jgi:sugar phosphate isomerase/epimerase
MDPMEGAMTRRGWLRAAGAAAAGALIAPAAAGAADAPAGRGKLRLGIMSDVYARFPLEEAASRMKDDGFHGVILMPAFADVRFDWQKPDWGAASRIFGALEKREIRIDSLFGYHNVIDPDPARRKIGEARADFLIDNWKRFGCKVISTETGTFNPTSEWEAHPDNYGEKGYLACRAAFERLAAKAEKAGAVVAIEPYWKNVIDSAFRAERLFREIGSPGLKLVMDPCNYFRKDDFPRQKEMLEEMFRRLGKAIVVVHAKDVKPSADGTDLPAAGLGVLDYPLYLKLLAGLDRDFDLMLEHLGFDDMPRARGFVREKLEAITG